MPNRSTLPLLVCVVALLAPGESGAQTGDFVWEELDQRFAGARFVGDPEECRACHADVMAPYEQTLHARMREFDHHGASAAGDCESCHGPRGGHVDDPGADPVFTPEQFTAVCLQCHQDEGRIHWRGSPHNSSEVACVSCHVVMEKRSPQALLSMPTESAVCAQCHGNVAAQMRRPSRHPVAEGLLECSSCHDAHGAPGQGMLVAGDVNTTCYSCHQDKRGPFLWEHPPVREDCLTCHEPHGSNNRAMLSTLSSTLCISCHQYGGHVNQYRYNRVSTPYGNGCVNCHTTLHGSNHPSGPKFNR